jgi:hypothetical protein
LKSASSLFLFAHLPSFTRNGALGVSVFQVVDVAQKLQLVIHGGNDGIQAVGDESHLLDVVAVASQRVDWNIGELGEMFLDARSLLEEPFNIDKSNDKTPLYIGLIRQMFN